MGESHDINEKYSAKIHVENVFQFDFCFVSICARVPFFFLIKEITRFCVYCYGSLLEVLWCREPFGLGEPNGRHRCS